LIPKKRRVRPVSSSHRAAKLTAKLLKGDDISSEESIKFVIQHVIILCHCLEGSNRRRKRVRTYWYD